MVERLSRTINISVITPEVLKRKTFGKSVFIIDAVPATEDKRLIKYSSYAEVLEGEGSSSEAGLFAKTYFANGAYGATPPYMWVYRIDIAVGAEVLKDKVNELLTKPEDFYFITCDENFTDLQKKEIAEAVELHTDNWYMASFEYTNAEAYDSGVSTDLAPVLGALNYEKTFINYSQKPSGSNQYLTGAVLGEMSGVQYTTSRGKYQPAKKPLKGILVNGLIDSNIGKLIAKNYNYYTATTTILNNDWYGFNSRNVNGNSFINQVAVDYMSYNLTVTLAELFKNTPIIGFDEPGLALIEQTLTSQMMKFLTGGALATNGVASDGELFPNGFKIVMPSLADITPADKASGMLRDITIRFLPKYSVTAIEITLQQII